VKKQTNLSLLFHGWIVMLWGWLNSIPYAIAISRDWDDDVARAWRVAHTGVAAAAVTVLLAGLILPSVVASQRSQRIVSRAMVVSGYGFAIGLTLGAIVGERGVWPAGPAFNVVVLMFNGVGAFAAVIGGTLILLGLRSALHRAAHRDDATVTAGHDQ
jgi:hypothetical protein